MPCIDDLNEPSGVPPLRVDREHRFANWCFTLTVTSSDGYRMQRGEISIQDNWSERDAASCVEALAMTAAGLIKAIENAGLAIYGDGAVQGFAEGYSDIEPTEPAAVPLRAAAGE